MSDATRPAAHPLGGLRVWLSSLYLYCVLKLPTPPAPPSALLRQFVVKHLILIAISPRWAEKARPKDEMTQTLFRPYHVSSVRVRRGLSDFPLPEL